MTASETAAVSPGLQKLYDQVHSYTWLGYKVAFQSPGKATVVYSRRLSLGGHLAFAALTVASSMSITVTVPDAPDDFTATAIQSGGSLLVLLAWALVSRSKARDYVYHLRVDGDEVVTEGPRYMKQPRSA